jgi:hypothetical protein
MKNQASPTDISSEKYRNDSHLAGKESPMPITLAVLISLMLTIYGLACAVLVQGQRQDRVPAGAAEASGQSEAARTGAEERQARAFLESEP